MQNPLQKAATKTHQYCNGVVRLEVCVTSCPHIFSEDRKQSSLKKDPTGNRIHSTTGPEQPVAMWMVRTVVRMNLLRTLQLLNIGDTLGTLGVNRRQKRLKTWQFA